MVWKKQGASLLNEMQGFMSEQSDIKRLLGFRGSKAEMDQHHRADARDEMAC